MEFEGFPRKMRYTPVPNQIFGPLLEGMDDLAEIKCVLRFLWLMNQKKGFPRSISRQELFSDPILISAVRGTSDTPNIAIGEALQKAVDHGILIAADINEGNSDDSIYLLNTDSERRFIGEVKSVSSESMLKTELNSMPVSRPNIFSLYEDNIGMLNSIISDELKEAEELYPQEWIEDAFRESVVQNKRSWRYVCAILERWENEGKSDGRTGRYSKTDGRERYLGE